MSNVCQLHPYTKDSDVLIITDLQGACNTLRNVADIFTNLQRHAAAARLYAAYMEALSITEKYAREVLEARRLPEPDGA